MKLENHKTMYIPWSFRLMNSSLPAKTGALSLYFSLDRVETVGNVASCTKFYIASIDQGKRLKDFKTVN